MNLKWILRNLSIGILIKVMRHYFYLCKHVCLVCDPACLVWKREWILKARLDNGCEK